MSRRSSFKKALKPALRLGLYPSALANLYIDVVVARSEATYLVTVLCYHKPLNPFEASSLSERMRRQAASASQPKQTPFLGTFR